MTREVEATELETIQRLYGDYLDKTEELERQRKPGDGLLGMGGGPDRDVCHDAFVRDLTAAMQELAQSAVPSDDLRGILEYMYEIPLRHRDNSLAYWMLLAVQGLTAELIPRLEPRDASELLRRYRDAYPRFERLPVQKNVLSSLKARA